MLMNLPSVNTQHQVIKEWTELQGSVSAWSTHTQGYCSQPPLECLYCPSVSLGSSKASLVGFTPAPCFHTSGLDFFFRWYMEFHRTSFIEGSIFFPEPFKNAVLFGCLSIFYFLIVSVTGTSNWEQLLIFTCFLGRMQWSISISYKNTQIHFF